MSVAELFRSRFERDCRVVAHAPGRVNLIGEHTDYNEGFVLPIAVEQRTRVAVAERDDDCIRAYSAAFDDMQFWNITEWRKAELPHWTAYVAGVAHLLRLRDSAVRGCDVCIESDVPTGGGLSSSAALETAVCLALATLYGVRLAPRDAIDLCRRAEHDFAGVPCGLMDQSVSMLARPETAFLLDCRSREVEYVTCRLMERVFLVVDSGVRHQLAAGEYALRQQQCRRALRYFQECLPGVRALRDVRPEQVELHVNNLEYLPAARARHVATENVRTLEAAEALRNADWPRFGRLMTESHRSLRDDYQVSCAELDQIVRLLMEVPGVDGARMTGGGFGGCAVALADRAAIPAIQQILEKNYRAPDSQVARLIHTRPAGGAAVEPSI